MFMGRITGTRRALLECPHDFDATFVSIGRLVCQEHYRVGRLVINRWLMERGKQRLIDARARHVKDVRRAAAAERRFKRELQRLGRYRKPIADDRAVSLTLARHAAQFLRKQRNGGWVISPASNGDWWVGTKRRSAAGLVEMALTRGFIANLSGEFGDG